MYRCDICQKCSKNGEGPTRTVVATRPRMYSNDGSGWEIASEVDACDVCHSRLAAEMPRADLLRTQPWSSAEVQPRRPMIRDSLTAHLLTKQMLTAAG